MRSERWLGMLLLVGALTLAGCVSAAPTLEPVEGQAAGEPVEAQMASAIQVLVVDSRFEARELRVPVGTTVVWVHNGGLPHTVSADDGSFDSGTFGNGETFSVVFSEPGTYPYYCRLHGAPGGQGMAGVVVVESP